MDNRSKGTNLHYALSWFWRFFVHSRVVQRLFVWTIKRLFGLRLRNPELVPLPGPCIFASNHASHYDLFFGMAGFCEIARDCAPAQRLPVPVVWHGVRKIPILGRVLDAMPCVWAGYGPGDEAKSGKALREMIRHLRSGRCLIMACEGQRLDSLGEFEKGAAFLSLHTGAPIVPVSFRGSQGLYSDISRPNRFRGNVEAVFHPPLNPTEFGTTGRHRGEIVARFTQAIRERVASQLDYPLGNTPAE